MSKRRRKRSGEIGVISKLLWRAMLNRCYLKTHHAYASYGGRGIKVCVRWRGPNGYVRFVADVGPRPSTAHTLDRFPDNDGDYKPGNVRWATRKEQQRNSRANRLLIFRGRTQPMSAWAEELKIPYVTLQQRLRNGWSVERALSTPASPKSRKLTFDGRTLTIPEWAKVLGVRSDVILRRLSRGRTIAEALARNYKPAWARGPR